MSVSLEETIAKLDEAKRRGLLGVYGIKISRILKLLRELQERRKQPEIIFCKDCKHKGTKNCVANAWTTIFGFRVKDDFYCGLAERVFNE